MIRFKILKNLLFHKLILNTKYKITRQYLNWLYRFIKIYNKTNKIKQYTLWENLVLEKQN